MRLEFRLAMSRDPVLDDGHDVRVEVETRGDDVVDASFENELQSGGTLNMDDLPWNDISHVGFEAFRAVFVSVNAAVGASDGDEGRKVEEIGLGLA